MHRLRWIAVAATVALFGGLAAATFADVRPPGACPRFGVYPGNTFTVGKYIGLAGTEGRPIYGDEALDAMTDLADGQPFDVHFYAAWREGVRPETAAAMQLVASRGLRVNLALKYVPPAGRDGDILGFAAWVAQVVSEHPEATTVQVTNEANSGASSDSDGAATNPLGALVEGVKAAALVKTSDQAIGFNWFYRLDPVSDRGFWSTLGAAGEAFRAAVDFAGVDIYAGTYMPPVLSIDDEADFRAALDYTRNEMMPLAHLGADVPIYVQETGFPTLGLVRGEQRQADALAAYIRAAEGFNVGLIQWFQLADARSTVGDGWGLLRDDYSRKPAFHVMRDAVQSCAGTL